MYSNTPQSTDDANAALAVGINTDEMLAVLQSSDEDVERTAEAAGAAGVATTQQQQGVRSPPQRCETRTTIPPVADVHGIQWFPATSYPRYVNGIDSWKESSHDKRLS